MSMLRSVLTYMGLGPDEEYDDGYLYEVGGSADDERTDESASDDDGEVLEAAVDLRDDDDPHSQRPRPEWLEPSAAIVAATGAAASARRTISIDDDDPEGEKPSRGRHDAEPVRPLRAVPAADYNAADDGITVRSVTTEATSDDRGRNRTSKRPDDSSAPRQVKPRALAPQSFGEAKILADEFKNSVPVIMNLQGIERDLARRLIDFASGVCYTLDGSMEKIASQVFLLTPQSVELSEEDRRRIEQREYDR